MINMSMRLIGSLTSPYARKVRIFLLEKKIDFDFVTDDVFAKIPLVSQFNPLGKVPCLLLEDGKTLFDSRVIIEYVNGLSPLGQLIPKEGRERAEVKCWEALADGILDAAVLVRLEKVLRPIEKQSEEQMARQWAKVTAGIAHAAQHLGQSEFCEQKTFTLADIALCSCLGWLDFRFPEYRWGDQHVNLREYYDRMVLRPSFISTIPKA